MNETPIPPVALVLMALGITVVNALISIACLGVLGLAMKLYTEYFKDRSQTTRKGPSERGPERSDA